jgi:hypothetical protein
MPSPPGRPFSPADPNHHTPIQSSRFEGSSDTDATQPAQPASGSAVPTTSQVSFVRTPDRVLRERRRRLAEDSLGNATAAASNLPSGSNSLTAADASRPKVPVDPEIAAPPGDAPTAWNLPSWLQPFAPSPDVRFTRTPETVLRRQALRHPRLGSAQAGPAPAPSGGSQRPIEAPGNAGPGSRPRADAAAPDPVQTIARFLSLPQIRASRGLGAVGPRNGPPHSPEEPDHLPGDPPPV